MMFPATITRSNDILADREQKIRQRDGFNRVHRSRHLHRRIDCFVNFGDIIADRFD